MVRVGGVESTGSVSVYVTDAALMTSSPPVPAGNVLRVVLNGVALVNELGTVQLNDRLLKVFFVSCMRIVDQINVPLLFFE